MSTINTTITNYCDICSDDQPKIYFVHCVRCLGSVCHECSEKLDKCPMCRAEPYNHVSLVKYTDKSRVTLDDDSEIVSFFIEMIIDWDALDRHCSCRKSCKHNRCDCMIHNKRYESKQLNMLWGHSRKLKMMFDELKNVDKDWFIKNCYLNANAREFVDSVRLYDARFIQNKCLLVSSENVFKYLDEFF